MDSDKLKKTAFLIDSSSLTAMYEGRDFGGEMAEAIQKARMQGVKFNFLTTAAAFQESIWKADPATPLSKVQDVLDHIEIVPSRGIVDFKNREAVTADLLMLIMTVSGKGAEIRPARKFSDIDGEDFDKAFR
jgi:hypothetical protein